MTAERTVRASGRYESNDLGVPVPRAGRESPGREERSNARDETWVRSLPRRRQSAAIDGASPTTAFFRLALPMSVPVLASLTIFQFLFVWNDLLVALIYLGATRPENLPLTVVVANLVNSLGGETHYLTAAAFVTMALPLVVFLALQRYFVRGITGGAVKG